MVKQHEQIAFVKGYLSAKIEGFSNAYGIPAQLFAEGLAGVVQSSGSGIEDRVSSMRKAATKVSKKLAAVEMDDRPRSKTPKSGTSRSMSLATKKKLSKIMKKRWADARALKEAK